MTKITHIKNISAKGLILAQVNFNVSKGPYNLSNCVAISVTNYVSDDMLYDGDLYIFIWSWAPEIVTYIFHDKMTKQWKIIANGDLSYQQEQSRKLDIINGLILED